MSSDRRSFLVAAFGGVLGALGLRHARRWEGMVPPNTNATVSPLVVPAWVDKETMQSFRANVRIKKGDVFVIEGVTETPLFQRSDGTLHWGAPRLREFIAE